MSFIDNLRTMLASFSGNDRMDFPDNYDELYEKQKQYGAQVPVVTPESISEGTSPYFMHPVENKYHPDIPELWAVEDYDIIKQGDDGMYYSSPNKFVRIYRDNNGDFVGLDTPMQSFVFSPEEDGSAKIKEILDGMQTDGKTIIQFRGRIENPRDPNNKTWRV